MMIVMKETATSEEIDAVVAKIEHAGALAHRSQGARVTVIGAIGDVEQDVSVDSLGLEGQPGVDRVVPILKPYKLASAQITHGERTVLEIEGRKIGGDHFALIAGPCTVESRDLTLQTARVVRDAMKAKGYRVRDLQISPAGVPPRPMFAMAARAMSSESLAQPAVEPGSTRILITVSGTIQLQ